MKYYVYVSDTKVDMLYSQIPQNILKKIAAEININLGIFSLNVKGKENQEKTRYEKLRLVVNYIENNMDVGTVDEPKAYFKGSLLMRWGAFASDSRLMYFSGKTRQTILGLGGSIAHVIGKRKGESEVSGGSSSSDIYNILHKELNLPEKYGFNEDYSEGEYGILYATYHATEHMRGTLQTLEFVAKRLVEGTLEGRTFIKHCTWYSSLCSHGRLITSCLVFDPSAIEPPPLLSSQSSMMMVKIRLREVS